MDPIVHIVGLTVIATILAALGVGLAMLNAVAVRLPLDRLSPVARLLPVALPSALWAGLSLYLLALMAGNPSAANLWPLTVALMTVLWLAWIALSWIVTLLLRLARRA
jgi:hypothetical protein